MTYRLWPSIAITGHHVVFFSLAKKNRTENLRQSFGWNGLYLVPFFLDRVGFRIQTRSTIPRGVTHFMADSGKKLVLLVDDDDKLRYLVKTVLEIEGFQTLTASNGQEALQLLQSAQPDLIVLDIMMPVMDGWTMLKKLRSNSKFAFVPVVFLTSLGSADDQVKGFHLGADDYLPKPFRPKELSARLHKVLERQEVLRKQLEAQITGSNLATGFSLGGSIEQFGIASILTMLEGEKKSGVLKVEAPEHGKAIAFFRGGRVMSAKLMDDSSWTNQHAITRLLGWSKGTFAFTGGKVEVEDEMRTTTTHLLLEAARLIDESGRS